MFRKKTNLRLDVAPATQLPGERAEPGVAGFL